MVQRMLFTPVVQVVLGGLRTQTQMPSSLWGLHSFVTFYLWGLALPLQFWPERSLHIALQKRKHRLRNHPGRWGLHSLCSLSVQSAQPDAGLKQTTVRTQRTAVLCPEPVFQLLQQGWCINSVNPKLNLLTNCLQRKMFQSPSERKCFAKTRPCDSNLVLRILILIIDIVSKNPTVLSLSKVSPLGNQTWLGWSVQWLKPSSATGHAPGIHSASPWLKNKARVHQEGNFSTNNVRDLCWGVLWQQKMSKWAVWNDPFVVFVCHQLITDKYILLYIYSSLHEWSRWHRYV